MTEEQKQKEYQDADWLRDTQWRWVSWQQSQPRWDHDYCFFCFAHICDKPAHEGVLRECWWYDYPADIGSYETVCGSCFNELQETFRWTIVENAAEAETA